MAPAAKHRERRTDRNGDDFREFADRSAARGDCGRAFRNAFRGKGRW